jgi:hypothetical protein
MLIRRDDGVSLLLANHKLAMHRKEAREALNLRPVPRVAGHLHVIAEDTQTLRECHVEQE